MSFIKGVSFGDENTPSPNELRRSKSTQNYASMPDDKRTVLNTKRRENYHHNKAERLAASGVNRQHVGKRVFIPRIPLCPSEDITLPFKFKRKQFPIRLSFAMTINKAHDQTIPSVGIYLPEPVFPHSQLYIALSRGVSRKTT